MLILLILYQRSALSRPMFYMSEYLEGHREEYYDRLLGITDNQDWHGWIVFFLGAMISQAEDNLKKVKAIRDLYESTKQDVVNITHSQYSMAAVDALFSQPIVSASRFAKSAGFNNRVTANSMLRQLEAANVVTKIREGSGRQPAVYATPQLINIAEGRVVM